LEEGRQSSRRNGEMIEVDRLRQLFRAFRDQDERSFRKVAEAIIADQLAANHHGQAKELPPLSEQKRNLTRHTH
jgi:hypothetical protein